MAFPDNSATLAKDPMAPHLAAQAARTRQIRVAQYRHACFMLLTGVAVVFCHIGFVVSRLLEGKALGTISILLPAVMLPPVASLHRRYLTAKAAQAAS